MLRFYLVVFCLFGLLAYATQVTEGEPTNSVRIVLGVPMILSSMGILFEILRPPNRKDR